jgi:hypothetical protein
MGSLDSEDASLPCCRRQVWRRRCTSRRLNSDTQFTCVTSTKVQMLTPDERLWLNVEAQLLWAAVSRTGEGAQFTCFTGVIVQMMTQKHYALRHRYGAKGAVWDVCMLLERVCNMRTKIRGLWEWRCWWPTCKSGRQNTMAHHNDFFKNDGTSTTARVRTPQTNGMDTHGCS